MNKQAILAALTPETVEKFRTAIELGKWADGSTLTEAQKQTCLEAVIIWEHEYLPETERTGYIHRPNKEEACATQSKADDEQPIKFQ